MDELDGLVSELSGAVQQEGDGSVVCAGDVHVCGEYAGGDGYVVLFYKLYGLFVELVGQGRLGCWVKAGAATFTAIAVQGKLADQQD